MLISPQPDQERSKLQRPNSNFCKPLKKKNKNFVRPTRSPRQQDLRVGRKMATFRFFSRVGIRTYQHPCICRSWLDSPYLFFQRQEFFVSRVEKCLHRTGGNVVQYSVTFLSENPSSIYRQPTFKSYTRTKRNILSVG